MILCVTFNPVVDTALFIDNFSFVYRTDVRRVIHVAGGKGNNTARALTCLGVPARVLNPLGGNSGQHEADLLAREGIETFVTWVTGETRVVVTLVDKNLGQQAYFPPSLPLSIDEIGILRERFHQALVGVEMVCLAGSSPSLEVTPLFAEFIGAAAAQGIPTLLDTYGEPLRTGLAAAPTIIKANRAEVSTFLGRHLDSLPGQADAVRGLLSHGSEWACLTLGADGALFATKKGCWVSRPPVVQVVNTIGSGDSLSAGLMAGRLNGLPPEECFRLGMAAASANTQTWEHGRFDLQDVQKFLKEIDIQPYTE
jgi:tagatose 6-phosphate kinase